jgi:hypothetical protein
MTELIDFQLPEYLKRRESAKRAQRVVQVVAVTIGVSCIACASLFLRPIDTLRQQNQITLDPESTKGLPPGISLMTKTGTFRALAIDLAFMRMEELKENNKYYEINKLANIICRLAPRFPAVWKYAAWNLAYNVSVAQYTPEGRWYWVSKGVNLLRNEGLRYNDKSIGLYLELAYIFWHKIGDFLDDEHWSYKKELAIEMERLLGAPAITMSDEDVINAFAKVANATPKLAALLEADPEVARFAAHLPELGLAPDTSFLDFVARNMRSDIQIRELLSNIEPGIVLTPLEQRIQFLTDPENIPARDRLIACLRYQTLVEDYNMDPKWMLHLMKEFGPLDWRTPYIHAIYWSTKGDMMCKGQLDLDENDSMNTVRYLFFGIALTVKRGKLVLEPDFDNPTNSYLEMLPDSRFIPYLHKTYLKFGKEQFGDDPRFIEGTAGPSYLNGHFTFLGDAIRQLYTEGGEKNIKLAQKYYAYLRKYNRNKDGSPKQSYLMPLKSFVLKDLKEDLGSIKTANMHIGAWLIRSLKWLSLGDAERSAGALNWANTAWHYYMKDKTQDVGDTERRHLPPLAKMRADAVVEFMQAPEFYIMHKVRLWNALGVETRRMTYDRLAPFFEYLCDITEPPLDVTKAFPEPPGMEEYRATHPLDNAPDKGISHGEKA